MGRSIGVDLHKNSFTVCFYELEERHTFKTYQSNQTIHYGRITKMGNKIARTTLVQSTLVAIRYSPYLRRFYDQVKARRGSGKAIIATSRKLLGIIYNTLKHNWVFEDFTTFKLATSS